MTRLEQTPAPGSRQSFRAGDEIVFELESSGPLQPGQAYLRTNIGGARRRRRETIEAMDAGRPVLALDWSDIPMDPIPGAPADRPRWRVRIPLVDIGCFSAKAHFVPDGKAGISLWPDGPDAHIKVSPAWTAAGCSVYCAFPRLFAPATVSLDHSPSEMAQVGALEKEGWTAIPPGGTLADLESKLDQIVFDEGFGIIQLLPIHPVPTTFAKMGRFGSPFASTDFFAVDPALARFDRMAPPLEQFRRFCQKVHVRGAKLFLDLPANHTGWASALQNHHPEWFRRDPDGSFHSPGAWGVVWADLVELDHGKAALRDYLASVFEFWCKQGVDGFRCDAGYMIPAETWRYIVARIRESFPDTVFLLEGLGGKLSVTDALLGDEGLDWAYSEIFQTDDRSAFEHYLPGAESRSASVGPLVHFAETHDNLRLAARSRVWARARTSLAALASRQGCWGLTCGAEWFATEKIDVHGASALRWGAAENQVSGIRRLNAILEEHPAFGPGSNVQMVQKGPGNSLALLRTVPGSGAEALVLANLDPDSQQPVAWSSFDPRGADILFDTDSSHAPVGSDSTVLSPGRVVCFARAPEDPKATTRVEKAISSASSRVPRRPATVAQQLRRAAALRLRRSLIHSLSLGTDEDPDILAQILGRDPLLAVRKLAGKGKMPPVTTLWLPADASRIVPVPDGNLILVRAPSRFRARMECACGEKKISKSVGSFPLDDETEALFIDFPAFETTEHISAKLKLEGAGLPSETGILLLPRPPRIRAPHFLVAPERIRSDKSLTGLLTNGRGAMSRARAAFGVIRSQYDALLAANPDPCVPCDRTVLLSRCRAWILAGGFSTSLDEACQTGFEVRSDSLRWTFGVPAGAGRIVEIEAVLRMVRGENRISLTFSRRKAGKSDGSEPEDSENVQLVVRPDVESRSFHATTKAFTGPEKEFPASVSSRADGFSFEPPGKTGLDVSAKGSRFVTEPEWHYMVEHPDEAERGQDGSGDLFSPGWFDISLAGGSSATIEATALTQLASTTVKTAAGNSRSAFVEALSSSLRAFMAVREDAPTVIAGFPWFLDWGRDTFIVLRGAIADGMVGPATEVARKFAAFADRGTLPNMICGSDASNRDTSDAPLWFCVVVSDLIDATKRDIPDLRKTAIAILRGYLDGTPNGIRVDPGSSLVYSPAHFTWMDTNWPAGTPREGYPVEIQALWIHALDFAASVDKNGPWAGLAARARESLNRFFNLPRRDFFSDCLHSSGGFAPAVECTPDDHLRPNQLFAVTLGAVESDSQAALKIVTSSERLLVPGAIRTLAPGHVDFELPIRARDGRLLNDPSRPYWGRYNGDEDTRRKPAYHNGTAWPWPFPSYCEALCAVYGESAREAARSLLASALPLLENGCIGHLPEITDGDAPHTGRGCDAQAWSASEFLRVAIKLGL